MLVYYKQFSYIIETAKAQQSMVFQVRLVNNLVSVKAQEETTCFQSLIHNVSLV